MPCRMRCFVTSIAFAALLLLAPTSNALAATPSGISMAHTPTTPLRPVDHRHDFDFLRGEWTVRSRRLSKLLQHSHEWVESVVQHRGAPLLDGLANYDELRSADSGLLGMTLRTFNRETRQWSIYWVAERDGVLQPPVVGAFVDGKGVFEGQDVFDGRSISVRYIWSGTTTPTPRWEQAFSTDGGNTWETNWIMEFSQPLAASMPLGAGVTSRVGR